ncbi:putative Ubiquitin fusion degradation protein Ufd1 [Taphrina deformans PYCC 5710]|uniref:Ubiquitin fusion degradation protein 1 n=1 Tax=Taphrina deformans (strain PYCC 5710 / ATCC 11124 / CBS 356.35 / IMI 108563 / JCM 9778 / NBRC 8474) TaxID=1097556 RepID=R4XC52_TAPDE|nr:putative Ubiquitin fusion degradation protein Ufd1 [Taphrina deformans PYCC 5710]|eukprot:CCG83401.1 putative Ubiquitin fusion degradation protein Ufd1 [Taphrina deformans PYCC 5710]
MNFGSPWSRANQRYDEYFRCYSSAMLAGPQRDNVNFGGKVILPPSALDKLTRLNIAYPMQFELRNNRKETISHAGVLEFIAEEGRIYLPHWMMKTLKLEEGDLLQVLTTDLPQGTFVQLEPQSPDFLNISDPKAVLENTMRNFSTLTKGDIFQFSYNESVYDIAVLQVKPESANMAISVIETDLSVDFATPKGYVEPERMAKPTGGAIKTPGGIGAKIGYEQLKQVSDKPARFAVGGQRLSGKAVANVLVVPTKADPGAPPAPLRLPSGTLFFGYELRLPKDPDAAAKAEKQKDVKSFAGRGQSIKDSARASKSQQSRASRDHDMHEVIEVD